MVVFSFKKFELYINNCLFNIVTTFLLSGQIAASCHIITLLTFLILHFWGSKKGTLEHIKDFRGMFYGFNGLDAPFSMELIEFFTFSF